MIQIIGIEAAIMTDPNNFNVQNIDISICCTK